MIARPLTDRQREVLNELVGRRRYGGGWVRPMDVGGSDGSHHSTTLRALVRLGFAERRDRYGRLDGRGGRAQSWLYRITDRGLEVFRAG